MYYFSHGPPSSKSCRKLGADVIEGNCSANVSHGWATHGADVEYGTHSSSLSGLHRILKRMLCKVEGSDIYYGKAGQERGAAWVGWKQCNMTAEEVALSDRMQDFWGSFARSGRPSAGAQTWPAFDAEDASAMQLDVGDYGGVRRHFKAEQCDFWERVAPLGPHATAEVET